MHDALEKNKTTTHFSLALLNAWNDLKVAILMSWTQKQLLLNAHTAIHACKLDVNFVNTQKALGTAILDPDLPKMEYMQLPCSKTKKCKTRRIRAQTQIQFLGLVHLS